MIRAPFPDQQFANFEEWVRHASNWLTRSHPEYNDTQHARSKGWQGHHFTALCFDSEGRRCRQGGDFMRARDKETFPVWWVWPDQIPALITGATDDGV